METNNLKSLLNSGVNITVSINLQDLRIILEEAIEKASQNTTKQELPKFLSPIQLSDLVGWKLTTVYQNHNNRLIPGAKKVGNRLLFETEIILSWIEEKSIPTKTEKVNALLNKRRGK